jgi:glycosyltransferase involved in cell wall biosynthesis
MRVFYLTTEFPYPPTAGGRVRSLAELRLLDSLPEVEALVVLSVQEDPVKTEDVAALSREVSKATLLQPIFHPVHLKRFPRHIPRVALVRALARVPYLAAKWDNRRLRLALRAHLGSGRFDVVYLDHLGMALYLPLVRKHAPGARVVLEQHNVESDFFGQFAAKQRGPFRLVADDEHELAQRFEQETLASVDATVAISAADARAFTAMSGKPAELVPQVVRFTRRPYAPVSPPQLLYVGSLGWHPNVQGLDWFCRDVWPLLRERAPELTLNIVGSGLPLQHGQPVVPEAWRAPGIITHGFVADLAPFEARAAAMIAPISGGSGVRIKLLEGFRAGLPVVTTTAGAAGLPLETDRELLIGDDPRVFADSTLALVRDPERATRLREAAYTYLDANHSVAVAQQAMRRALGLG